MKLFSNFRIRSLFRGICICILCYLLLSVFLAGFAGRYAGILLILSGVGMGLSILLLCLGCLRRQEAVLEDAAARVEAYLAGRRPLTLDGCEEGELSRLFHEINTLASLADAHAEKETEAKQFFQTTVSDISHQLKTPLAALQIYNGLLQEEGAQFPSLLEYASLSEQELDRIGSLVQNLLKIARLDAGTIVLEQSAVSLAGLLQRIRSQFQFAADRDGKEIFLSGDPELTLFCDPLWMEQAIGNLVQNALAHTQAGDCIRIEWQAFADIISIRVSDNGSGIHPEDLMHIFKRFYRSRFSKDTQGAGLGLPLAKAITEAHRGTISVDSTLGKGTSFTMHFLVSSAPFPTKL